MSTVPNNTIIWWFPSVEWSGALQPDPHWRNIGEAQFSHLSVAKLSYDAQLPHLIWIPFPWCQQCNTSWYSLITNHPFWRISAQKQRARRQWSRHYLPDTHTYIDTWSELHDVRTNYSIVWRTAQVIHIDIVKSSCRCNNSCRCQCPPKRTDRC